MTHFYWENLSKKDKKKLSEKNPVLILGPRDISQKRIRQLDQQLASSNKINKVIWGCLEEKFIAGLENSPQFASLKLKSLKQALSQKSTILSYPQHYAHYVLREIDWSGVIAIYGSWHKAFHFTKLYQEICNKKLNYKLTSSFIDETEAKSYYQKIKPNLPQPKPGSKNYKDQELMSLVQTAAQSSFDYTFQTGAVLAKDNKVLLTAHNKVLPYETYMLHKGATKEKHFDPPQDLNHFDTNHAEVEILLKAVKKNISLKDTSLYINLLPCPTCARMLAQSEIAEIVYQHDHSEGYGFRLLKQAGKTVRRMG